MYKDPSLPPRPLVGRRAEPSATPPGCRTYQSVYQCDTLAGSRDRLRCLIHGSSGLRPSTAWLRSGHPQGVPASTPSRRVLALADPSQRVPTPIDLAQRVPTPIDPSRRMPVLTDFVRLVVEPEATTSHRLMDPDWDPRFIATGRAATAAKTCGPIDALTSTPCGSQSLSLRCAATRMGARSEINSHTSVLATLWFDRCLGSAHPCGCSHAGSQMRHPHRVPLHAGCQRVASRHF